MRSLLAHAGSLGLMCFLAVLAIGSSEKPSSADPEEQAARETRIAQAQQEAAARQEKQEAFKKWALANTAVIDIAFAGDYTIFVTLKSNKYTNRDNVRVIAESLARACAQQTGVSFATCKVYHGNTVYAEGDYGK